MTRDDALVPLEVIRIRFNVSRMTVHRWLKADSIVTVDFLGGKAVRWGDIVEASRNSTRWPDT